MQVSYPLSFKVSLWLMLNLLLLAALGIGFFVFQGGLGWSALVAGPTGLRAQAKANIIASEVAAAEPQERAAVLNRFKAAYGADLFLFRAFEPATVIGTAELPEVIQTRVSTWRHTLRVRFGEFGPGGGRGSREAPGFRDEGKKDAPPVDVSAPEPAPGPALDPSTIREPPPNARPPQAILAIRERESGRFIERAGSPANFWIALRVGLVGTERGRISPGLLLVRVDSFWSLLHFLDLQPWVLAATGVLLLSVLFWLPLVRGITRSIGQLTAATEQIAQGRFDTRVHAARRDELGKLGDSVNRMASRLDAHMTGQKRFLGDVAHELCSPLARLQMATGILAEQAPKNLQETVTDVREEVQQMSTLVNELLAFTKAGLKPREITCQSIHIAAIVRDVLAREDSDGRVITNVSEALHVFAESELLSRALGNLVRNALRYAGDAGPIVVNATRDGEDISLAVEDEGPGVPAVDLDRLGEPFFRPELARTRESGGVGLGLAIVRSSIIACGGEVRFANRAPRGFRAELRLPAA